MLKCHLESLVARYSIPKSGKSSFQNDAPLGKNLDRKLVSSLLMSEKYYEMYPLHTCSSIQHNSIVKKNQNRYITLNKANS